MAKSSKFEIVSHWETDDIDELTEVLLNRASDKFLDKALEKRLNTIEAKSLLNALARAERLGYDAADILEEHNHEQVIPAPPPQQPPPKAHRPSVQLTTSSSSSPQPIPTAPPTQHSVQPQPQPAARSPPQPTAAPSLAVTSTRPPPALTSLHCPLCSRVFNTFSSYTHVSQTGLVICHLIGQIR
jgi:hypothetical protein